jgi:uncharacterized membrane protein YfcA
VIGLPVPILILLVAVGLVCGIGITALGPGGVLATIGLYALTNLTPAQVAGTAIVTNIAAGVLGAVVYTKSGQLREPQTRRIAVLLAATAIVGTPVGVLINSVISGHVFGLLLAAFVAGTAVLVWYRDRAAPATDAPVNTRAIVVIAVGVGAATAAGMFGIGGPMLTVPLLVALRVPVLSALAAAQAQSVVIGSVGTIGYLAQGAIDWPLAALVGIPAVIGALAGWAIARALPTQTLKYALLASLLAVAPYLALRG